MTTPTLALGISATGRGELEALAKAVGDLKGNLEGLKGASGGNALAGMEVLVKEFREMRQEMAESMQGLRTDLAAGFQKAFDAAAAAAKAGGEKVAKELADAKVKMRTMASLDLGDGIKVSGSISGNDKASVLKFKQEIEESAEAKAAALATANAKIAVADKKFLLDQIKRDQTAFDAAYDSARAQEKAAAVEANARNQRIFAMQRSYAAFMAAREAAEDKVEVQRVKLDQRKYDQEKRTEAAEARAAAVAENSHNQFMFRTANAFQKRMAQRDEEQIKTEAAVARSVLVWSESAEKEAQALAKAAERVASGHDRFVFQTSASFQRFMAKREADRIKETEDSAKQVAKQLELAENESNAILNRSIKTEAAYAAMSERARLNAALRARAMLDGNAAQGVPAASVDAVRDQFGPTITNRASASTLEMLAKERQALTASAAATEEAYDRFMFRTSNAFQKFMAKREADRAKASADTAKEVAKQAELLAKEVNAIENRGMRIEAAYAKMTDRNRISAAIGARTMLDGDSTRGIPGAAMDAVRDQYGPSITGIAKGSSLAGLQAELEAISSKHGPAAAGAMRSFAKELEAGHSAARGLASGLNAIWLTWGSLLPLLAGAALSHTLVQAIKGGSEVEQQLTTIRVLSEESTLTVEALKLQLMDLGAKGPFGPIEVAKAMKTLSLAGLDARGVFAAIKDVLNLAVAGDTSIEKAADVMTTVGTAFKIGAQDYNYIGDVISKTAAISKASVESVASSFKTASVINSQYGVSLKDVGVGIAVLSNVGVQASAAGTSLRNFYVDILGRTPKVQKAFVALGLDADWAYDKATGKARGFVEMVTTLQAALAKKTPIGITKATNDVFSERGGKLGSESISLVMTDVEKAVAKAKALKGDFIRDLQDIEKAVQDSAGFMAISFAEMQLTSSNQMKSTAAALQTALVKSFDSLQPYLIQTSQRLRDAFSSEGFQDTIRTVGKIVGELTVLLTQHSGAVLTMVGAWLAFKSVGVVFAIIEGAKNKLLAATAATFGYATAAKVAEGANSSLAVSFTKQAAAQEAAKLATEQAGVAATTFAGTMGNILRVGGMLLGWIGLAVAAWQLYEIWSDRATTSGQNKVDHQGALLTALRSEAERLEDINKARLLNITLEELQMRKRAEAEKAAGPAPDRLLQEKTREAERFEKLAAGTDPGSKATNQTTDPALKKFWVDKAKALRDEVGVMREALATDARFMAKAIDTESERIREAAEKQAKAVEEAMRARQIKNPAGTDPYELPKDPKKGGGPHDRANHEQILRDNELSTIDAMQRQKEASLRDGYNRESHLLDLKHKGDIVTEGVYQAQALQMTEKYERDSLQVLAEASVAEKNAYEKRKAEILRVQGDEEAEHQRRANVIMGEKRFEKDPAGRAQALTNLNREYAQSPEKFSQALANLDNDYARYSQNIQTESDKIINGAFERQRETVVMMDVEVKKLTKTNSEYWAKAQAGTQKELDLAEARQKGLNLSEEERVALEARTKVLDSHVVQIDKLKQVYSDANSTLVEFIAQMSKQADGGWWSQEALAKYDGLTRQVNAFAEALRQAGVNVEGLQEKAAKTAVINLQVKKTEDFAKGIADSISSAIVDGSKSGGQKLKDLLKNYFIREPLKVQLDAIFKNGGPLGNFTSILTGGKGDSATAGSSPLGSTIGSAANGVGSFFNAALGSAGMLATVAAVGSGIATGLGEMFGLKNKQLQAASIGGALLGGLPGLIIGSLVKPGGGPKTESGFGTGVDLRGDPAAAKSIIDNIQQQYTTLSKGLGGITKKLDLGFFTATDPKGNALTQVEAVASLNGQALYNRKDRLGGVENVGRSEQELTNAIAEETERILLGALQKSNIAGNIGEYLSKLGNLDSLNKSDLDKAVEHVQQAQTIQEAWFNLTATDSEKLARTREQELAALDDVNKAQAYRVYALQDEISAQQKADAAIKKAAASAKEAADFLTNVKNGFTAYVDKLNATPDGLLPPGQQRDNALQQLQTAAEKARHGDRDAAGNVTSLADQYLSAQKAYSASGPDTVAAIAYVKQLLANLPAQLKAEDFIVKAVDEGTDQLSVDIKELIRRADINAQAQIDALNASSAAKAAIDAAAASSAAATAAPKAELPMDPLSVRLRNAGYTAPAVQNQIDAGSGGAFANGGVMSAYGPLSLRKYASGGIATHPQLALYGEGSMNEAYVPLPDGRSIPVSMHNNGTGNLEKRVDELIEQVARQTAIIATYAQRDLAIGAKTAQATANTAECSRRSQALASRKKESIT